jgi:hypothetical protein
MTDRPRPGIGGCPHCGVRVLFALAVTGDLVALDEGRDGPVAVRWDCTRTPRVRRVPPAYRPGDGEHRFRLHNDACIGLAPVVSIGRAPSLRRRPARSAPPRREARAR